MIAYGWYVLAALAEIAGCFAFWATFRKGAGIRPLILGLPMLCAFAFALTKIDAAHAGRAFAAYGGIYILVSLIWLRVVEGVSPDRWDLAGALLCVLGSIVILFGPRAG